MAEDILKKIMDQHKLDIFGLHGMLHWMRVRDIGLRISKANGASKSIIRYFAILHDSCREDEGHDKDHGRRSATYARRNRKMIDLSDSEFETLIAAIEGHTDGKVSNDINIGTCWDADRLDLGRVGIRVQPQYISTDVVKNDKELYEWAINLHNKKVQKP